LDGILLLQKKQQYGILLPMYSTLAAHYDEIFPLEEAKIDYVQKAAGGPPAWILDLGCSTGSLAFALSKRGYAVKAIDLDEEMISIAQKRAWGSNHSPEFFVLDMMKVNRTFPKGSFDLALCLGNTLVHLKNLKDIEDFFRSVAWVLKGGGRFIVQILNYEMIGRTRMQKLPLIDREKVRFERWYEYDSYPTSVIFRTILTEKETGARHEDSVALFPLTVKELEASLDRCGFSVHEIVEDFQRTPFSTENFSLVLSACRKA